MTNKRSGNNAKSSAGAKRGKPKLKKETLKDLDVKGSHKIQGGASAYCNFTVVYTANCVKPPPGPGSAFPTCRG